ncbi:MAG: FMN-binding protein [Phycisphaerae bacterium]|nr:FMN-binding protein [Gemmatimonadaceae bacterium]
MSNNRKTGHLVALGSAAVVAVYGAGFMRTAAAAERFAQQSTDRVLSPEEAEVIAEMANQMGTSVTAATDTGATPSVTAQHTARSEKRAGKVDATTATVSLKAVADTATPPRRTLLLPSVATATVLPNAANSVTSAPAPAPTKAASVASSVVVRSASPTAASATTPAIVAPPNATQTSTSAPAPVPATATVEEAPPVPAAPLKWKDGGYTGYGTSRHGDIEVYLETDGGRISYVKISQCLTQYSCSWIKDLPGQVLARQGPQVDATSGATQSANAFYYAVVQALSKAK